MLEFLRKNVNGLLGFTLVGALTFVFALSFGQQGSGWGKGQSENIAVSVRGEDIPESTMRYMLNMLGRRDSNDEARAAQMERTAIDAIIERQLLLDMGKEAGISASIEETEDRIAQSELYLTIPVEDVVKQMKSMYFLDVAAAGPALLKNAYRRPMSFKTEQGNFDYEHFSKFVKYQLQVTEEEFVEQQRLELVAERIRQLLVSGVRVSPQEVRDNYNRENNTATISYIRLIPTYFADRLDPTPEEMTAWIEANGPRIQQYYETNKYKYTNLEKMARASHILKKVAEDATEEEKAKARTEMDGIVLRLKAGEEFADLAREASEDPGSGSKGGDLGFNPRGRMVPEFDEVMFSLEPGQVSDVVETKFGYHIIKLDSFREGNITLEEATPEIAEQLYRETEGARNAEQTGAEYLTKLKAGTPIEDLLPKEEEGAETPGHLGLKVRSTAPFAKNASTIPGLGKAPKVIEATFKLTPESPVPAETFVVRGDVFVFVLKERNEPSDEEFEKQKDEIAGRMLSMKQAFWLRARVATIRDTAEKNGDIGISERYYSVSPSGNSSEAQDLPKESSKPEEKNDSKAESKSKPEKPAPIEEDAPDNDEGEEDEVE